MLAQSRIAVQARREFWIGGSLCPNARCSWEGWLAMGCTIKNVLARLGWGFLLWSLFGGYPFAAVPNSIFLEAEGSGPPRPITISRVFARGDIPHYAQAIVDGTPVPTQCNVKTRWPDGSVQHALISFWFRPEGRRIEIRFRDQAEGMDCGGLTAQQMLSGDYEFGAIIELEQNGRILRADAREMLAQGSFRYWLEGPICTQVIIEDLSPQRRHDLGWDEHRSFHPIFVATFYPGWRGVRVELIGENAWTTALQDLTYTLRLRVGNPPMVVYERSSLTHYARTRWRKVLWSGPEPVDVNINHNLAYLVASRVVPNYDLTLKVPSRAVQAEYEQFLKTDRGELNGSAQWVRYFGTTGGRGDIGLFPRWYVRYLYTFDRRLREVFLGNAHASGHVPIHYREGLSGRRFLAGRQEDAFGRVVSVDARPTVWLFRLDWRYTAQVDRIVPLQSLSEAHGWAPDLAHQPSFVFLPYILTGDWYFLEELYFWAAFNVASGDPCPDQGYCRNGRWGIIPPEAQTRGVAWGLRTLAHAAFAAPDGSAEKAYFLEKLYNNIAVREGFLDIRDGRFYDPSPGSMWRWGRQVMAGNRANPLRYMDLNDAYSDVGGFIGTARVGAPWMMNFVHVVMGHLEELGFPVDRLRREMALHLLGQLLHPDYNPYLTGAYRMPVLRAPDREFFQDWASVRAAFPDTLRDIQSWPQKDEHDAEHGYPNILRAAVSFMATLRLNGYDGWRAWEWVQAHVNSRQQLMENPKWAFLPRLEPSGATRVGGEAVEPWVNPRSRGVPRP